MSELPALYEYLTSNNVTVSALFKALLGKYYSGGELFSHIKRDLLKSDEDDVDEESDETE